jgi:hypothetical protein
MSTLKKFLSRLIRDAFGAPSYSGDPQKKRQEKEQMSEPQEEFIDSKSIKTKNSGPIEGKKSS